MPVVRALVTDGAYSVRALSRDGTSERARALTALGNVTVVEGSFADEDVLRQGLCGCAGAFVNINGFNTGEKTEMYWAIRSYEIALEEGVEFFVYGNLDYGSRPADTIPGSAPATMTARAASVIGFSFRTSRIAAAWALRCSPRARTWKWRSHREPP